MSKEDRADVRVSGAESPFRALGLMRGKIRAYYPRAEPVGSAQSRPFSSLSVNFHVLPTAPSLLSYSSAALSSLPDGKCSDARRLV